MSADSYSECPQCRRMANDQLAKKQKQLDKAYGRVDADAYQAMAASVVESENKKLPESLREDYEFYLTGEVCEWTYSWHCQTCSLSGCAKGSFSILETKQ